MNYVKTTPGYVRQIFNNGGRCIRQEFIAMDGVEYGTEEGDPINPDDMPLSGREYHHFGMEQP